MFPTPYWSDMPSSAFGEQARDWIAVLPLAAIEQHGPHLPVGVDTIIAQGLVERCAKALPAKAQTTFLPVQQICKSDEHRAFPGTLTRDWKQVINDWVQIGQSVYRSGPRKLVMITSHGGNTAAMDIAARELRNLCDMAVVTTSWGRLGRWGEIYGYGGGAMIDIHAGLAETSLMLALRPDLVDMDKAQDFKSAQTTMSKTFAKLALHGGAANMAWAAQDLNPHGAVGDASGALAKLGEQDLDGMVQGFIQLIEELRATPAEG